MKISEFISHLEAFQKSVGDLRVILTWEGTTHDVLGPQEPGQYGMGMEVDSFRELRSDEEEQALYIDADF